MPSRSIFRKSETDAIESCLQANGAPPNQVEIGLLGTVDDTLAACKRLFPHWWQHQIIAFVRYCTGCTHSTVTTRLSKLGLTGTWKVAKKWSKQ